MEEFKFAVLISGNGSNLQAIIDATKSKSIDGSISCVLCNNSEAYGLLRAKKENIPTEVIDHRNFTSREDFDLKMIMYLDKFEPDLIVLAGFMRILSSVFVKHFLGKLINIHPSLLPKYSGLNTHERVLQSDDKFHGITIHFVDESLDGGPICAQSYVQINTRSTKKLEEKIHVLEHRLYPNVINLFGQGKLKLSKGKALLDNTEIKVKSPE